jgi:hypothetical protein
VLIFSADLTISANKTSWFNIAGRIFASDISKEFECYTYPVYKQLDMLQGDYSNSTEWVPVPETDPNYARLPWAQTGMVGWATALSIGPMVLSILVGSVVAYYAAKNAPTPSATGPSDAPESDGQSKEASILTRDQSKDEQSKEVQ